MEITREMLVIEPSDKGQDCSTCPLRPRMRQLYIDNPLLAILDKEFFVNDDTAFCAHHTIKLKEPAN